MKCDSGTDDHNYVWETQGNGSFSVRHSRKPEAVVGTRRRLDHMEPISVLITKNSTMQVEKLDHHHTNQEYLYRPPSANVKRFAFLPRLLPSVSKRSKLDDEEMAHKIFMELNGVYSNSHANEAFSKQSELDDETMAQQFSMELNGMYSNSHLHKALQMSGQNHLSPCLPSRSPGEIIARASCSQFKFQ